VAGNPSPDLYGDERPGDNLYTDSLVAIDLDQGTYKCHFQYVAHDVWDLDAVSPPILVNVKDKSGNMRPRRAPRRQDRPTSTCHDRQGNCSLIRLLPGMIRREHVGAADAGGRAHAAGRERRREWSPMALGSEEPAPIALNLHQPMTYHVEAAKYPGGSKLWLAVRSSHREREAVGRVSAVDVDTGKVPGSTIRRSR